MTERARSWAGFFSIYVAVVAAHSWLLRLPYFWDEAGYYIPAARDFFLTGHLIPSSTLTNAHPPLPSAYLAAAWTIFGYSPLVTRSAMLLVAAFALFQVFQLATRVANREVAVAATVCFAAYPVFFAQSSLAHADLPATALTLWALRLYVEDRRRGSILAFALAALAKETAILTPLVLAAWEVAVAIYSRRRVQWWKAASLLVPVAPLALWFGYHYLRTGFVFGNPEFLKYNVTATLSPLRFLLAALQRVWQVFGHMNMWLLTAMTAAAMLLPPLRASSGGEALPRPRIAVPTQLMFAVLILAHIVLYSLIGGALLSRYLMAIMPLVIIIAVSTLWRRVREWKWLVAMICAAFVAGWFVNPPYRFAPEDNLSYADFVRLHQHGAEVVSHKFAGAAVLTAWPASDELRKPYLGYVSTPQAMVFAIENFSFEQIMIARQSAGYDVVFLFSTKYEPPRRLFRWAWWEKQNVRFFDDHEDLAPETAARILGGVIVMQESRNGQWVALVEMPRTMNAGLPYSRRSGSDFGSSNSYPRVPPASARGERSP